MHILLQVMIILLQVMLYYVTLCNNKRSHIAILRISLTCHVLIKLLYYKQEKNTVFDTDILTMI